jgi:hypothetical protein
MITGSWVIVDSATGKARLETFDRSYAEFIQEHYAGRYEVLTALQWLQRFNASPEVVASR